MAFPAPPEQALEQRKPAPRRFGFHREFQRNREHCLHLPGIEFPANIPRLISSLTCFRFAAHFRLNFFASNTYPLTRQYWICFKARAGPLPRRAGKQRATRKRCRRAGGSPPRSGNFNRFAKTKVRRRFH